MRKQIKASNTGFNISFEDISTCPICNAHISTKYLSSRTHLENKSFSLYCECPSCGKPFIAFYNEINDEEEYGFEIKFAENLEFLAPTVPVSKVFDNKISDISPNFIEIYNQSISAESYKLNQIAGMGYRKALEFLIKDYCIYKNSDKKDEILKIQLSQCINTFIDNDKIKNLAKVSAWLGNDETHYIKKFENKDINDLKRFIDTTLYFILYTLTADEAEDIIESNLK